MKQTKKHTKQVKKQKKENVTIELSLLWKILGIIAIVLISILAGMLITGLILGTWFPNSGLGGLLLMVILLPLSTIIIGSMLLVISGWFLGKQHKAQKSSFIGFLVKVIIYGITIFIVSWFCLVLMIQALGTEFHTFALWIFFMIASSIYFYKLFFKK